MSLLYADNFDTGTTALWKLGAGWTFAPSENGLALQVTASDEPVTLVHHQLDIAAVQARFRLTGGMVRLSLRQSREGSYSVLLDASGQVALYRGGQLIGAASLPPVVPDGWRTLRLSAVDSIVRVAVDGVEVIAALDPAPLPAGTTSFAGVGNSALLVDDTQLWGTASSEVVALEAETPTNTPTATSTPTPTKTPTPTRTPTFTPTPIYDWTYTCDFRVLPGDGWQQERNETYWLTHWEAGYGWLGKANNYWAVIEHELPLGAWTITYENIRVRIGSFSNYIWWDADFTPPFSAKSSTSGTRTGSLSWWMVIPGDTARRVGISSYCDGGCPGRIEGVTYKGKGVNPFGVENCIDLVPTATPTTTPTPTATPTETPTVTPTPEICPTDTMQQSIEGAEGASIALDPTCIEEGSGLRGDYYNGSSFEQYIGYRIDGPIDFNDTNWGFSPTSLNVQSDNFSVVWTGDIRINSTGEYTFCIESDDGVRLWIDGQLLINNWTAHARTRDCSAITLDPGFSSIHIEYYENAGEAIAQLLWSEPNCPVYPCPPLEPIPYTRLYPATSQAIVWMPPPTQPQAIPVDTLRLKYIAQNYPQMIWAPGQPVPAVGSVAWYGEIGRWFQNDVVIAALNPAVTPNAANFITPMRSAAGGRPSTRPDGFATWLVTAIVNGVPQTTPYVNSNVIEIKARRGSITPGYESWQMIGMFDIALNQTNLGQARNFGAITIISTSDTIISPSLISQATTESVILCRARVLEIRGTTPLQSSFFVEDATLQNPAIAPVIGVDIVAWVHFKFVQSSSIPKGIKVTA